MLTSRLDAYILRYGDFCANDNDNDDDETTDYFTLAHVRGVTMYTLDCAVLLTGKQILKNLNNDLIHMHN